MVTFTKVLDTNSLKPEVDKAIKDWGPASESKNQAEWDAFSSQLKARVAKDLKVFATEQVAFASEMEPLLKACSDMTGNALLLSTRFAKEPGATTQRMKFKEQFDATEALFKRKMGEAQALRTGLVAHQGFRENLFEAKVVPHLTGELQQLNGTFSGIRKKCIDKSDELSKKFQKARDEYTERWAQASKRIADTEKAPNSQIVQASSELDELKKLLAEWKDQKSAKWAKVKAQRDNLDPGLKNPTAATLPGLRLRLPVLEAAINTIKANLNTDYKRLEALQMILGDDLKDKKLLDQKLVSEVSKGFEAVRSEVKDLQQNCVKAYGEKIDKAEKKLKKT
jgi:hypothetical protein